MQTCCVLWSESRLCPSTSEDEHDVIEDRQTSEHRISSTHSYACSTRAQTGLLGHVICALICLLLVMTNTCNAAPLHEQPSNSLQNSIIYSSMTRSSPADVVIPIRSRRSISERERDAQIIAMSEKKSYPRICYFSPIQCLFSASSDTSLTNRRR